MSSRAFDLHRVRELLKKELRQIFRDPQLYRILFAAPLVQLLVFGYAVSTEVRHTATFVVDHAGGTAARRLVESLTASGFFDLAGRSAREADLVRALDHGTAVVGVVIPATFAADLAAGRAEVQLLVDGTNSNVATVALGQAEGTLARLGIAMAAATAATTATAAPGSASTPAPPAFVPPVELRDRAWYNPDLDSRDYNVPAVVGALIFLVCLLLTPLAVVRERELGTLEQLMVTPLSPFELVVGKALPFALICLVDFVLVTTLAVLWFRIPFAGSPLLLLLATVVFLLPALGLGLVVSTTAKTQQEAFMTSYLILVPAILLSGFMFPVRSMPWFFRTLSLANPLRHYTEIVRGVFLKGTGLPELWPQHLALLLLGLVYVSLAAARLHKRIG
jgi:ABC-2 type transport system permease protein